MVYVLKHQALLWIQRRKLAPSDIEKGGIKERRVFGEKVPTPHGMRTPMIDVWVIVSRANTVFWDWRPSGSALQEKIPETLKRLSFPGEFGSNADDADRVLTGIHCKSVTVLDREIYIRR